MSLSPKRGVHTRLFKADIGAGGPPGESIICDDLGRRASATRGQILTRRSRADVVSEG